ncbi:hypothetical protein KPL28_08430 [Clostridium algidicarnis]|uniref:hypothetical protein n=1 Tax=Clostridium algidicarnis TaxID=37659 RepID=UPI001C0D7BC1|nr:hypothetical protein [Clostridium algidicarnis]MBU3209666.1 hypothetical protein [Clostridium algidicarnis]
MRKVNKIISTLLCLLLVLTSVPITALAEGAGVGDNDNGGGGGGSGSTGGSFTWQTHLSGYRFALVDKDMNQVSNTVDFVFSSPSSSISFGNDLYTNSRVNPLSTSKSGWTIQNIQNLMDDGFISTVPKFPVQFEGTRTKGGGEDFKKWFLNSEGGLDSIETSPPYHLYTLLSNSISLLCPSSSFGVSRKNGRWHSFL